MNSTKPISILLVDDDPIFRETAAAIISRRVGADLIIAHDGHEAEKILENWCPTIMITDTNMPRKNGVDLIKTVRARCPNVVIFSLFSGLIGSTITADEIMSMGVYMVVQKKDFESRLLPTLEYLANL